MLKPIALALLVAASAPAAAEPERSEQRPEEARIPFPSLGGVRNFRTVGEDTVYFQDRRRNWYRATIAGSCFGLHSAIRIGLDTRYSSTLDNTAVLIVDGQRCPIHSLVRSDPPPRRQRR